MCGGLQCEECVQGVCVDGSCACESGYEGELCDRSSADKFFHIGYTNNLFCADTTLLLETDIKAYQLPLPGIVIIGLAQAGDSVFAYANQDSIIVPEQIYGDGAIVGKGLYSNGTVSITVEISDGMGGLDNCVAVLSR